MSPFEHKLVDALRDEVGAILAKSIVTLAVSRSRVNVEQLLPHDRKRLAAEFERGCQLFVRDEPRRQRCLRQLTDLFAAQEPHAPPREQTIIDLTSESDIVKARGLGRDRCRAIGFTGAVQIKVATAISELARNVMQYAGEGRVTINTIAGGRTGIEVIVQDEGPGIEDLDRILAGDFSSKSGMGIGIVGTRNLMDECDISTAIGKGTVVTVRKYLE
jgi:serine/threonine-protein kinase RsbT